MSSVIKVSGKYGSKFLSDAPQGFLTYVWKRGRRNPVITALIALLIALAVAIGWNIWRSELTRRSLTKGIAVLPFEDLSADPDNAYLADGIQEEILARLTKIADLKVISRPSTQHYQTKPTDLAKIAKQLGVTNVLQGSVRKVPDRVRVNVQLINAQTNSHVWADAYDRKFTDIVAVESEIATGIAESLQVKLTGARGAGISGKADKQSGSLRCLSARAGFRRTQRILERRAKAGHRCLWSGRAN